MTTETERKALADALASHLGQIAPVNGRIDFGMTPNERDLIVSRLRAPELIGDQRPAALQDSAYIAGAKAGYNLGLSENHEGLQAIVDGRQGYLAALSSPPPPSDTGERT